MALSTRFALDGTAVVAGAFLTVSSMTFAAPVAGWISFAVSTGVLVAALGSVTATHRTGTRIGHGVLAAAALWSLIAALVFAGPVLTWLVFADAIGIGTIALLDLVAHEVGTERVVHTLDIRTADAVPTTGAVH